MPDRGLNQVWPRRTDAEYLRSLWSLFRSGKPEAQDSVNALKSFLSERNYPPPDVNRTLPSGYLGSTSWGGKDSTIAPSWTVSGYTSPPTTSTDPILQQLDRSAATVPHELAHVEQVSKFGGPEVRNRNNIEQNKAFYRQGATRAVYVTPGTIEHDASWGTGMKIQDTLSQYINRARLERLSKEQQ